VAAMVTSAIIGEGSSRVITCFVGKPPRWRGSSLPAPPAADPGRLVQLDSIAPNVTLGVVAGLILADGLGVLTLPVAMTVGVVAGLVLADSLGVLLDPEGVTFGVVRVPIAAVVAARLVIWSASVG
jgi:hypothetical protein